MTLQAELKKRGLDTTGKKAELEARLADADKPESEPEPAWVTNSAMPGTGECSLRIIPLTAPTPDAPQQFTAELHGATNELFRTKSDDSALEEIFQTFLKSEPEFVQVVLAQGGAEIPIPLSFAVPDAPAEGAAQEGAPIFEMCRQDSTAGVSMSRQGSLDLRLVDFLLEGVDAFVQEEVSTISPIVDTSPMISPMPAVDAGIHAGAVATADVQAGFSGLGASILTEYVVPDGVPRISADILDNKLSIGTTGVAVTTCPSSSEIRVIFISDEHLRKLDAAIKSENNQFASPSMLALVGEFCGNLNSNGGTGHRKNSAILWQCRHCWPTLSNDSEWFPCSGRHWNAAGLAYHSEHSGREYETPKRHCGVCPVKHSWQALKEAVQQQHPKYPPEAIDGEVTKERAKWEKRCKKQPQRRFTDTKRKAVEGKQADRRES